MSFRRVALAAALAALFSFASAQDSRWGVRMGFGQAWLLLGSEDIREGVGIGVNYTMPFSRLRYGHIPGELLMEAYLNRTHSTGASSKPPNTTMDYGLLAVGRYTGRSKNGVAGYLELGWGLQYTSQRSVDLDSRLNSTPLIGLGIAIAGEHDAYAGVRFMHISNAGTIGRNQGQNQFFVTMTVKL